MRNTPNQGDIEIIADLYKSDNSASQISKITGFSPTTIYKYLRLHGVSIREAGKQLPNLDHSAFDDTPNEYVEYWAGFIAADGHLNTKRIGSPSLDICLGAVDTGHLEKFNTFLGNYSGKVYEYTRSSGIECCSVSITSPSIVESLDALGVKGPNLSDDLVKSRHFWRGVFDGDGYISKVKTYPVSVLSGKDYILDRYSPYLSDTLDINIKISKHDPTTGRVNTKGSTTYKIVKHLYQNANVYLDRKMARATDVIDYYESK